MAGHAVTVLNCFTRSAYAPYSDADALHENDRTSFVSALRRREDLAWQKKLGQRLQLHDLDLFDAPLRLNCAVDEVTTVDPRPGDRALARMVGAVEKLARKADAVLGPLAIGGHIDHRLAAQATLEALPGAGLPLAFYEDLPYAAHKGTSAQIDARAAEIGRDLRPAFGIRPAPDTPQAIHRKARLAECYDSQIDSTVVNAIAEFSRQYGGRERLWVTPAWLASPLTSPEETEA